MTYDYDKLLPSSGALEKSVSSEKILDLEMKVNFRKEHHFNNKQQLPITPESIKQNKEKKLVHKRSQSDNFELTYNKNKVQSKTLKISSQKHKVASSKRKPILEEPPLIQAFFTYFCYTILRWFGNLRELLRKIGLEKRKGAKDNNSQEFAPLFSSFENFFMQNFYMRGRDCFNRPICSTPGAEIELVDRKSDDYNWSFYNTGTTTKVLNMGSYNYLGFAENSGKCTDAVTANINEQGVASCSARQELGTLKIHIKLEKIIAKFLNTESAIVFGMGFATNAVNIPALVDKKCLIMSDELNHTSLILGSRLSGATVKVFKHNQPKDLEAKLKAAIIEGHPVTKRPWKKVLIVVEGIYSMEGTILNLPEIIAIKKKYKAYLYLDEAHSIGALGVTGRGICEYWGVDTRNVDILMGTFSKSFGAAGGYVAASNKIISYLKHKSHAQSYASSMAPPVCEQIISAFSVIMDQDGSNNGRNRIKQLKDNSIYFRDKLVKMGFIVYGDIHSPIVPVMFYLPTKCLYFNRLMLEKGIAVVSVGFPATNLIGGRARFCMSASHSREMLDKALAAIDYCGGHGTNSKISKYNPARSLYEVNQLEKKQEAEY